MRMAFLLSLLPALAFGQAQLSVQVQGQSALTVNTDACGVDSQVSWTAATSGLACSDLVVWASTQACSSGVDAGVEIGSSPQSTWRTQGSGTFTFQIDDLPLFDGGVCGDAVDQTVNLCASYTYGSFDCSSLYTQPITSDPSATLRYDALPPERPTITAVNPLDGALSVRISAPDGAVEVSVELRRKGDPTFLPGNTYSADLGGTELGGLENGVAYELRARVTDEARNQSDFSDLATGTPQPTAGFWENYLDDGGKESGGCAVGGGGLLGLLLLAGVAVRGRRNR